MKTYRKAEAIVTQYNQDLAEWEQAVKNGQKPAEKQNRPPERQSVRNRLRQLQEEGKQNTFSLWEEGVPITGDDSSSAPYSPYTDSDGIPQTGGGW